MSVAVKPVLPYLQAVANPLQNSDDAFDFYHCSRCGRLITRLEETLVLSGKIGNGRICPCGSPKYVGPRWPKWYQWLLPRVVRFAYRRWQGLV